MNAEDVRMLILVLILLGLVAVLASCGGQPESRSDSMAEPLSCIAQVDGAVYCKGM